MFVSFLLFSLIFFTFMNVRSILLPTELSECAGGTHCRRQPSLGGDGARAHLPAVMSDVPTRWDANRRAFARRRFSEQIEIRGARELTKVARHEDVRGTRRGRWDFTRGERL